MTWRQQLKVAAFGLAVLATGVAAGRMTSSATVQQRAESTGPPYITYQGRQIPNTIEAILDPKHTVLVVHELLNDFISVGGASDKRGRRFDADRIIQPVAELLAAARKKNVRVAYVRWTRFADGSTNSDPQRRNPDAGRRPPSNIEGTWGWEAPEAIEPMPGDWVLPKWRQDAFYGTQLDALMRWNGIKTMVIVGLGAEVGIVPTVQHASTMGYYAVAVEDCMVPSDPARMEDALKFIRGPARVTSRTDVIDIWARSEPRPVAPVGPAVRIRQLDRNVMTKEDLAAARRRQQQAARQPPTITYEGREVPVAIEEVLNPAHTVLLVHEMLKDFSGRGGAYDKDGRRIDADRIVPPMVKLLDVARQQKVRVAYVRWTNYADGSTSADSSRRSSTRTPVAFAVEGTPGWEIMDEVKPAPGDWVIRKYRPDAFFATPLDTLMRWNGIKTLVVVGIGSEAGVVPTLMHASNLGYYRVAVSDALAPANPAMAEEGMRWVGRSATIKTSGEIIDIWKGAEPTPMP